MKRGPPRRRLPPWVTFLPIQRPPLARPRDPPLDWQPATFNFRGLFAGILLSTSVFCFTDQVFSVYVYVFFFPSPARLFEEGASHSLAASRAAVVRRVAAQLLAGISTLMGVWGANYPPAQQEPRNTLIMEQVFFPPSLFLINWSCRHSTRGVRRDQSLHLSLSLQCC